jgi:hypothetical protein
MSTLTLVAGVDNSVSSVLVRLADELSGNYVLVGVCGQIDASSQGS